MADKIMVEMREAFAYDPQTGILTWAKAPAKRVKAGAAAGTITRDGYVNVTFHRRPYRAHRIAWMLSTGNWPTGEIDHIDGNRTNNRLANLRDVSRKTNAQNRRFARKNSKSGLIGATWSEERKNWSASIMLNGKLKRVGTFNSAQEAHEAYVDAKRKLHSGCTL